MDQKNNNKRKKVAEDFHNKRKMILHKQTLSWNDIPLAIQKEIFLFFQPSLLGSCFQVNKSWNFILSNEVHLWKHYFGNQKNYFESVIKRYYEFDVEEEEKEEKFKCLGWNYF